MSAVDAAITELNTELAALGPQYEGLKDYTRLNIGPDTLRVVNAVLMAYDRRVGYVTTARDLLVRLRDDGYPGTALQQVTAAVYADLRDQEVTIAAALALFASDPAATLNLAAQPPIPK